MAIRIEHLNKHIGRQHVLRDVNLTIGDGEVVGLLGPNGAGKSTLMKILVGVWEADRANRKSETVSELNVPKTVGYLPELNPLYEDMYVREYLRFFVELRTSKSHLIHPTPYTLHSTPYTLHSTPYTLHQQVEDLIERVGLTAEANKRVGQLSKGYKQRVGLAQAMIGDPELLILDEPTTGLDPNQLEDIRALIREMGKDRTVILSTHILQEVKQMCSRVIIIDHGQIKVDKPLSEIENLEETFKEATRHE